MRRLRPGSSFHVAQADKVNQRIVFFVVSSAVKVLLYGVAQTNCTAERRVIAKISDPFIENRFYPRVPPFTFLGICYVSRLGPLSDEAYILWYLYLDFFPLVSLL